MAAVQDGAVARDSTVRELLEEQDDFEQELRRLNARRWGRRAVLAVLAAIVGLGIVGVFGERSRDTEASSGGLKLGVTFPSVVRAGPPASLEIRVERADGFQGPVDIAFDSRYMDALDQVVLSPQPEDERTAGDDVVWTFSQPAGDSLVVRIDAQVSSQARFRHRGHVAVVEHGSKVVEADFTTWVWP